MHNRGYKYLTGVNLLYNNQFGFRRNRSTSMALIQLVNNIASSIDSKETTVGVFFDLSKVLDTTDHQILLKKASSSCNRRTNPRLDLQLFHKQATVCAIWCNSFTTHHQTHRYNTRNNRNYRTHYCKTNIKQFTIVHLGPKVWNSLRSCLKIIDTQRLHNHRKY